MGVVGTGPERGDGDVWFGGGCGCDGGSGGFGRGRGRGHSTREGVVVLLFLFVRGGVCEAPCCACEGFDGVVWAWFDVFAAAAAAAEGVSGNVYPEVRVRAARGHASFGADAVFVF